MKRVNETSSNELMIKIKFWLGKMISTDDKLLRSVRSSKKRRPSLYVKLFKWQYSQTSLNCCSKILDGRGDVMGNLLMGYIQMSISFERCDRLGWNTKWGNIARSGSPNNSFHFDIQYGCWRRKKKKNSDYIFPCATRPVGTFCDL